MVGLLGISLVPVVVLGSFILDHITHILASVSAYYYTSMRNGLVGILCGISMFLLSYNGYTKLDAIASKSAGVFALGIAFFPTSNLSGKAGIISELHYITAAFFFAILAFMSIFLFTKSSGNMTPQKKKRNRVYRVCGIIMIVTVIGIPIVDMPSIYDRLIFIRPKVILEFLTLTSFGISWLTKGEFILADK